MCLCGANGVSGQRRAEENRWLGGRGKDLNCKHARWLPLSFTSGWPVVRGVFVSHCVVICEV